MSRCKWLGMKQYAQAKAGLIGYIVEDSEIFGDDVMARQAVLQATRPYGNEIPIVP